ncbi:hypothetical protein MNV_980028 [Candidatus Methanoperedens nitroreducens]|uniref:Uncharacterized protein n=1 Tax=Candidatus Methanoperedens nitratireducens TaxID=1392998 RepID=A0A284VUF2_9EURY|nr:hypothetical protein MNV_980028 [Candidatus Methanoperedens nitroreducens]
MTFTTHPYIYLSNFVNNNGYNHKHYYPIPVLLFCSIAKYDINKIILILTRFTHQLHAELIQNILEMI